MAAVLAAALVLAACDSGPDVEPIEPPENAAEPDPEPEPDEEPEDDVPEIFQGQLYPPLPDLEPDERGGDLDIQREILAVHAELYDVVERGITTNDLDLARVEELASADYVELLLRQYEEQRDSGLVSLSPDASVEWVRVTVFDDDEGIVAQCVELGPLSGGYDESTGEPRQLLEDDITVVRTFTYRLDGAEWTLATFNSDRLNGPCEEPSDA